MEKMLVVYKAIFSDSPKIYIGITQNLEERKRMHSVSAKTGSKSKFHKAIRKYGNPSYKIIEICDSIDVLKEKEKFYIKHFDTYKNGYNSTLGGDGTFGSPRPKSEKFKRFMSELHTGENHPQYGTRKDIFWKKEHSERMEEFYKNNPNKKAWNNKSSSGMVWINDGINEKKIYKSSPVPNGFVVGRKFSKRSKRK